MHFLGLTGLYLKVMLVKNMISNHVILLLDICIIRASYGSIVPETGVTFKLK